MTYLFLVRYIRINACLSVFILSLLLSPPSIAKNFSGLYPLETLKHVQNVYGKNIRGVLYEDIFLYLMPDERQTLSTITLTIPIYGDNAGLFEYYMDLDSGEMTIPALSVKFFDDLAIAFAWYERKKMDKSKIIKYVSKLYSQRDYLQPPLEALGVPEKAWELDPYVDDVSQKILKSGLVYLLLHELGHWHYHHKSYDSISNRKAQQQEKQSDALALDVMGRMHTIPFGMVPWFFITGLLSSDIPTTHPISADRLYAIVAKIERNQAIFISRENANIYSVQDIQSIATEIRNIADNMKSH